VFGGAARDGRIEGDDTAEGRGRWAALEERRQKGSTKEE
jgi:hypothetical protein